MASAVPLSTMIANVRRHADMIGEVDRAPDSDVREALNENLSDLYDLLRLAYGQDYFAIDTPTSGPGTILTVVDQHTYPLPGDFLSLLSVMVSDGTNFRTLTRWERQEVAPLRQAESTGSRGLWTYRYRLVAGGKLEIRPAPSTAAHTLIVSYVPRFQKLYNSTDTFDGINGWELFAELGAAIDLKNAEDQDTTALVAKQNAVRARIMALAGARDGSRPKRMQDVEERSGYGALPSSFDDA